MGPLDKLNDDQLIALLKQGDHAAFREIYQRYDKLLYLFAYRKLKDKEEAKDIVQEVFAWLWNNRNAIPEKAALSSYLYKSVLNKIFDIFRHQNIIRKWIDSGKHYIDIADTETDYLIREKDIQEIIQKEIDQMPPRMKEIYELKRKQYLSVKEIAEELDLSEHTVATQLKRAQKHLKLKLGMVIYVLFILHL
jgi:RNA polymerase sigma-70 factor (ECF subfamily)